MKYPPHHQGNLVFKEFGKHWASQDNVPEPNLFQVYALAHKAPFKSAMPYNDIDTSCAYTSKTAYNLMVTLKSTTKKMKGLEYDVTSEPLDHKLVMIAGGGRKHDTEAIGGGMFPNSSRRTLPEYIARLGMPKSSICQCKTPAMVEINSRLEEERRLSDERLEARLMEERRQPNASMQEALAGQTSQYFKMFQAYCSHNGMPAMGMPAFT
ncbi:hypothetical protein D1007_47963 [Hordeum vulgare]|nr:hypothetical protein D1007_47963 [Hordeum vulgare]